MKDVVLTSSLVADALRAEGSAQYTIRGLTPLVSDTTPVMGRARTLRLLPFRTGAGRPGAVRAALFDRLEPGDILVCDTAGLGGLAFGDMAALRGVMMGLSGAIIDGAVRDVDAIAELGLPLFAKTRIAGPAHGSLLDWDADIAIQCGGALVMPGDWVVADGDGAIVIPDGLLATVQERASSILEEEAFCQRLLRRGHSLADVYPMPERLRALYERCAIDGTLPDIADVGPVSASGGVR
jgi:regulator of RNase E activity RraA